MTDNKLMLCPFCGGEAVLKSDDKLNGYYWVRCCGGKCNVMPETAVFKTKKKAIAAWNRRAVCAEQK